MPALTLPYRLWLQTWGTSLALLPFCVVFAVPEYDADGLGGTLRFLVHSLNLLPHEAGHFVFRFFGTFLMYAGGTLLQLFLPGLFVFQSLYHDHRLGLQLSLLWLGQSFVDVSAYAADAQARALPLLGNLGPEHHDWWNVLSTLGLLEHTPLVAGALYGCAFLCWAAMLAAPRWVG
ncbi:MAG: hypothetical protein R3362_02510 [Rhodothermales bacterium]|nr:hypothetical protein [Rhodothermales bacterium]